MSKISNYAKEDMYYYAEGRLKVKDRCPPSQGWSYKRIYINNNSKIYNADYIIKKKVGNEIHKVVAIVLKKFKVSKEDIQLLNSFANRQKVGNVKIDHKYMIVPCYADLTNLDSIINGKKCDIEYIPLTSFKCDRKNNKIWWYRV